MSLVCLFLSLLVSSCLFLSLLASSCLFLPLRFASFLSLSLLVSSCLLYASSRYSHDLIASLCQAGLCGKDEGLAEAAAQHGWTVQLTELMARFCGCEVILPLVLPFVQGDVGKVGERGARLSSRCQGLVLLETILREIPTGRLVGHLEDIVSTLQSDELTDSDHPSVLQSLRVCAALCARSILGKGNMVIESRFQQTGRLEGATTALEDLYQGLFRVALHAMSRVVASKAGDDGDAAAIARKRGAAVARILSEAEAHAATWLSHDESPEEADEALARGDVAATMGALCVAQGRGTVQALFASHAGSMLGDMAEDLPRGQLWNMALQEQLLLECFLSGLGVQTRPSATAATGGATGGATMGTGNGESKEEGKSETRAVSSSSAVASPSAVVAGAVGEAITESVYPVLLGLINESLEGRMGNNGNGNGNGNNAGSGNGTKGANRGGVQDSNNGALYCYGRLFAAMLRQHGQLRAHLRASPAAASPAGPMAKAFAALLHPRWGASVRSMQVRRRGSLCCCCCWILYMLRVHCERATMAVSL